MKIELDISKNDFEFAERKAHRDGYFGPEDCLTGILNTAVANERHHDDDLTPAQAERRHLMGIIDHQNALIRALKELLSDVMRTNVALEDEVHELCFPEVRKPAVRGEGLESQRGSDLDDGIPF